MISQTETIKAVAGQVRRVRGRFAISGKATDRGTEIPPIAFLLPLIGCLDEEWPFDDQPTPPTPREVGECVELLRACRFLENSRAPGGIAIVPDRERARTLGAYDTPAPVVDYLAEAVVTPLCDGNQPPLIVDPACGAGYFVLAALDILVERFPGMSAAELADRSLRGLDLDPVAIALSRRNLRRHLEKVHGMLPAGGLLDRIFQQADALADRTGLPSFMTDIDGVLGNPPYQFFSGRGSPVAALRRSGRNSDADRLAHEIDLLSQRFPRTSQGCRDRYKWFIDRAVECLKPRGRLGFITPNTWLAYPRYRDMRRLLAEEGQCETVIDLGSLAFRRAHVPAAILVWRKSASDHAEPFPLARISREGWKAALSGDSKVIPSAVAHAPRARITSDGNLLTAKTARATGGLEELVDFLLNAPPEPHRAALGDVAVLREGSHAIRAVPRDIPRNPAGDLTYPVLIDKTLGPLAPPEIGYMEPPRRTPSGLDQHSGSRFLLRKTGDRLIVAPSPTDDFALAHQNVYVGKLRGSDLSLPALIGILHSPLLTELYRSGPGGQHGRPLAQLRICFLNRLPIVVVPTQWRDRVKASREHVENMIGLYKSGRGDRVPSIPRVFPSEPERALETALRIAALHDVIARMTLELVAGGNESAERALGNVVYHLYGGT